MISVEEFVTLARSWIGVPFHHQGRSRLGVDCAGLPECVLREADVLPDGFAVPSDYGRVATGHLQAELNRWCRRSARAVPGCLVLIRWPRMEPSHVAICTGTELIHAYRPTGPATGVVTHAYRGAWLKWTESAWLLPGVDYDA